VIVREFGRFFVSKADVVTLDKRFSGKKLGVSAWREKSVMGNVVLSSSGSVLSLRRSLNWLKNSSNFVAYFSITSS